MPSPRRPEPLVPHANRSPSLLIAAVWPPPPLALTLVQLLLPIWTGLLLETSVLSPSWPKPLFPHANRSPSLLIAIPRPWPPALTLVQLLLPIWTGLLLLTSVLSPRRPLAPAPHVNRSPSFLIAIVKLSCALTLVQLPAKGTGSRVVSETCPNVLLPHANRSPSLLTAAV